MTVFLRGRLDILASNTLHSTLSPSLVGVKKLILDLGGLEYISSAGLRILLLTHKYFLANQGTMLVRNVPAAIGEILDQTGFSKVLNIGN